MITTDPDEARSAPIRPDGQQEKYLVLSEEERAKGFVRPLRRSYRHVGARPRFPLRALTPEEAAQHDGSGYVAYEEYLESATSAVGRFWTQAALDSGCGSVTTMADALAETYARDPGFYHGTFCARCGAHFPVGERGEFVWDGSEERVGT